jgi:DNA-binding NarL/FixJ family response regulator
MHQMEEDNAHHSAVPESRRGGDDGRVPVPSVIICDPLRALREAVAAALHGAGGVRVRGSVGGLDEALKMVAELQPTVIVVNPDSLGRPLGAIVTALRGAAPRLAIVVLTTGRHDADASAELVWQLSLVDSCGRLADLVRAVRTAAGPEATVGRRVVGGDLTARQWQVAACMTEGLDATAIAHRLSISKHTARAHIRAIYRRLNAHSATEAVALIRR